MSKVSCAHCHLRFEPAAMIADKNPETNETLYFCCKGCQGVYRLLHAEGLESFYDKVGDKALHPASETFAHTAGENVDSDNFIARYCTQDDEGFLTIRLIIEGIHCSACVWLNEKVLHKLDGVVEASINYSTHKAKVTFDPETVSLSKIFETIRAIGYNAYPYDATLQEERTEKERKSYYTRILVAVFGMMNIMWLAIANYAGYFSGIEQRFKDILHVAEFLLATPVLFYSGWIFFRGAYYGLKNRTINMDTLVSIGALSAYLYSIYAMITRHGEVYFDSVVMIITFVLVGKYLEVLSKKQAVDTIDTLMGTIPTEVTVIKSDGTKAVVSVDSVAAGDLIELKPGEKAVIDGIVKSGACSFDESSLTGESLPVYRAEGDEVRSGAICLDAPIRYEASRPASESLLHSIVTLLEDAVTKKPRIEALANRISGYFSAIILSIALLTFAYHLYTTGNTETALIIAISVVVIACPCALGLATPMATLVGLSVAAKRGILFKEAQGIERTAQCTLLAFDKTGTLTEGKPSVVKASYYDTFSHELLLALCASSTHPISRAIVRYLQTEEKVEKEAVLHEIQSIEARGIAAKTEDGTRIAGGNRTLMQALGIEVQHEEETASYFYVALQDRIVARFVLEDRLKAEVPETIKKLKSMGIKTVMLTGDNEKVARKIAEVAGIEKVYAALLPQEKAEIIRTLQEKGETVMMAGDGINDAVALAQSHIAVAMGSGADVALKVSDIVLLDDKIAKLYESLRIAKRTFHAVKENLSLSLLYNLVAVPLAVTGHVSPLIAALSMSLSSLIVVGNSMRIKRLHFD